MEKGRAGTFTTNNWWPHDAIKNHGANSKRVRSLLSFIDSILWTLRRWLRPVLYTPLKPLEMIPLAAFIVIFRSVDGSLKMSPCKVTSYLNVTNY